MAGKIEDAEVDKDGTNQFDGSYIYGTPKRNGDTPGSYIYHFQTGFMTGDYNWAVTPYNESDGKWTASYSVAPKPPALLITLKYDGNPRDHAYKWVATPK